MFTLASSILPLRASSFLSVSLILWLISLRVDFNQAVSVRCPSSRGWNINDTHVSRVVHVAQLGNLSDFYGLQEIGGSLNHSLAAYFCRDFPFLTADLIWTFYGHYKMVFCVVTIFCLFWFFTFQSTIFQSSWNRSSWVESALSRGYSVLLKDTMQCLCWVLNLQPLDLESSTLPLHSSRWLPVVRE